MMTNVLVSCLSFATLHTVFSFDVNVLLIIDCKLCHYSSPIVTCHHQHWKETRPLPVAKPVARNCVCFAFLPFFYPELHPMAEYFLEQSKLLHMLPFIRTQGTKEVSGSLFCTLGIFCHIPYFPVYNAQFGTHNLELKITMRTIQRK